MSSKIRYYQTLKLNAEIRKAIDTLTNLIEKRASINNKTTCLCCKNKANRIIIKFWLDDKIIRYNYFCSRRCFEDFYGVYNDE